ncbi:MAG: hypothetical protein F6J94_24745 [Moorea sp. SIO1F2]|uniref:hypothetical protein n=1 Tax=unclassified Moorena TaxID=2683338 RepID=UPI0013BDD1B1|nr:MULTISPECIES: hypothetical protein [unclassified Moorena]NEO03766.1 hypothetical protein [Moorena sp. SIO3I7]NEO39775.1 hypothetical protein [Moorena sp. SIOASIH]NEO09001.1 hypothetical protein [Moorena sp. SIO3I8]NEO14172.1 hypothetical protein [Moorena sp. SIO3E8]NEO21464.1 hypothetical protein [Moorena sp. SIO4A5]
MDDGSHEKLIISQGNKDMIKAESVFSKDFAKFLFKMFIDEKYWATIRTWLDLNQ